MRCAALDIAQYTSARAQTLGRLCARYCSAHGRPFSQNSLPQSRDALIQSNADGDDIAADENRYKCPMTGSIAA
jgi:hypothetical protein